MEWEETNKEFINLLDGGETEQVLARTEWMLTSKNWFSEYRSEDDRAEIWAFRGMAFYQRREHDRARMSFESALGYSPENKRAVQGIESLNEAVEAELIRSNEEKRYGPAI